MSEMRTRPFGGGKEAEVLGEADAPVVQAVAAPGLARLARDVTSAVRAERRVAEEAARVRLARQTAGYD